jgi:hypothetical protein
MHRLPSEKRLATLLNSSALRTVPFFIDVDDESSCEAVYALSIPNG